MRKRESIKGKRKRRRKQTSDQKKNKRQRNILMMIYIGRDGHQHKMGWIVVAWWSMAKRCSGRWIRRKETIERRTQFLYCTRTRKEKRYFVDGNRLREQQTEAHMEMRDMMRIGVRKCEWGAVRKNDNVCAMLRCESRPVSTRGLWYVRQTSEVRNKCKTTLKKEAWSAVNQKK